MHERNDGVIALRHGFGKGIIVIPRYVALNVRLAGKDFVSTRFEDVRKQDGRAFARIVNVGLEAHAEHGDLRAWLHVARDAVGRPGGLAVVDEAGLVDERGDVFKLLVDEPRIDRDAVAAETACCISARSQPNASMQYRIIWKKDSRFASRFSKRMTVAVSSCP